MEINQQFYLDHTETIKFLLRKKGCPDEVLEDLTQDVFSTSIKYQSTYDDKKGKVSTWLGLIVTHVWDRHLRGSDVMSLLETDVEYTENLEAQSVTQEEVLQDHNHWYLDNKEEADSYLNMLPKLQREKLYMFLVLGFSHREIARTIQITEQSSRTLISIAVRNLKKLVKSIEPKHVRLQEYVPKKYVKPYSGDWAWRPGESLDRSPGTCYTYNEEEIEKFCRERNLLTSTRN